MMGNVPRPIENTTFCAGVGEGVVVASVGAEAAGEGVASPWPTCTHLQTKGEDGWVWWRHFPGPLLARPPDLRFCVHLKSGPDTCGGTKAWWQNHDGGTT